MNKPLIPITMACTLFMSAGAWPALGMDPGPPEAPETELVTPDEAGEATPPSQARQRGNRQELGRDRPRGRMGRRPDLSPEERQQLVGALRKALKERPVREARNELRQASENFEVTLTEAILEDDPELAPLMEKMQGMMAAMMVARAGRDRQPRPDRFARPNQRPGSQTNGENRPDPAVMQDPEVIEARQAVQKATSRPERISAFKKLRQAMDAAKARQMEGESDPAPETGSGPGN